MSISPIVDAEYRLHAADLDGQARRVVIANVTYQGLEEMTPVLHFEGQTKRLVLSPEQVATLIDITGTLLYPRWVGLTVILQPPKSDSDSAITIHAHDPRRRVSPIPATISEDRRGWYLALSVVTLLIIASVLYLAFNFPTILLALQQLRDNWPLR